MRPTLINLVYALIGTAWISQPTSAGKFKQANCKRDIPYEKQSKKV